MLLKFVWAMWRGVYKEWATLVGEVTAPLQAGQYTDPAQCKKPCTPHTWGHSPQVTSGNRTTGTWSALSMSGACGPTNVSKVGLARSKLKLPLSAKRRKYTIGLPHCSGQYSNGEEG